MRSVCEIMELKRVNVVIDADAHKVLIDYQTKKGFSSKDKALAELLRAVKDCEELN